MAGNMTLAGNSEFKSWVSQLKKDIRFSHRNLKYIRQWYEFYNQQLIIGQQVVAQLGNDEGQQPVATIQSRTFGTVGDVCECRQSYQEEANRQPYSWIAYLQNQK